MQTAVLDTAVLESEGAELDLTGITTHAPAVTLYVSALSENHSEGRVAIYECPVADGPWVLTPYNVRCCGSVTMPYCTADKVKAVVTNNENYPATVTVYLKAK